MNPVKKLTVQIAGERYSVLTDEEETFVVAAARATEQALYEARVALPAQAPCTDYQRLILLLLRAHLTQLTTEQAWRSRCTSMLNHFQSS